MTPALRAADALLVEVTRTGKAEMQRRLGTAPELVYITEGPSLIDRLPPAEWQQVAALAQEAGIPPFMAAKMRPWFLSMSLAVPDCARRIEDLANGLDMRLLTLAEAEGVPARALEDPLSVFRALNAAPLEQQVRELRSYLALMQVGADAFHTMVESYFDGEVYGFMRMQLQSFLDADLPVPLPAREAQVAQVMEALLFRRNRAWVPVIEETQGDRLVIAVGAAHLPGAEGLLALLAAQGYEITEVPL